jgi:hypothetical protein
MTTRADWQQRNDHRLQDLVQRAGDFAIATDLGVPRSTACRWLGGAEDRSHSGCRESYGAGAPIGDPEAASTGREARGAVRFALALHTPPDSGFSTSPGSTAGEVHGSIVPRRRWRCAPLELTRSGTSTRPSSACSTDTRLSGSVIDNVFRRIYLPPSDRGSLRNAHQAKEGYGPEGIRARSRRAAGESRRA